GQGDGTRGVRLRAAAGRMARRRGVARGDGRRAAAVAARKVPICDSVRGLDTGLHGRQVSSPSIRFRKSYPLTRDRVVLLTPRSHAALNAAFVTPAGEARAPHPESGGSYGSGLLHRRIAGRRRE